MTLLGKDVIRFGIVGSVGFLVDSGVLTVLVRGAEANPLSARLVSMTVAILCTWLLHRFWTFPEGRLRGPLRQTFIYGMVQLTGLSINYGVFSALIVTGAVWRAHPVLAVAAGSLSAMVVTYFLSKTIAFADPVKTPPRKMRPAQSCRSQPREIA
jgi:putative flippase GtrA